MSEEPQNATVNARCHQGAGRVDVHGHQFAILDLFGEPNPADAMAQQAVLRTPGQVAQVFGVCDAAGTVRIPCMGSKTNAFIDNTIFRIKN